MFLFSYYMENAVKKHGDALGGGGGVVLVLGLFDREFTVDHYETFDTVAVSDDLYICCHF